MFNLKSILIFVFIINISLIVAADSLFTIQSFQPSNIKDSQIRITAFGVNDGNSKYDDYDTKEKHQLSNYQSGNISINSYLKYEKQKSIFQLSMGCIGHSYKYLSNDKEFENIYSEIDIQEKDFQRTISDKKELNGSISLDYKYYFQEKFGSMGQIKIHNNSKNDIWTSDLTNGRFISNNRYNLFKRENKYKTKSDQFSTTVTIGSVFGRIYEGDYSAKAIEIINELKHKNQIKIEPTYYQMKQLATIIYKEKNSSYYDSRDKRKKNN